MSAFDPKRTLGARDNYIGWFLKRSARIKELFANGLVVRNGLLAVR